MLSSAGKVQGRFLIGTSREISFDRAIIESAPTVQALRRPTTQIDPFATEYIDAPHVAYGGIRRAGSVVWCEPRNCWLVVGYHDARTALSDTGLFSSHEGMGEKRYRRVERRSLLTMDPPEHGPVRAILGRSFTATTLKALEPIIEAECNRLLRTAGNGEFDLVADYASLLPVAVIARLLGLTARERVALHPHVLAVSSTVDVLEAVEVRDRPIRETHDAVDAVFRKALMRPTTRSTPPALRALQDAARAGELSFEEILSFCTLLFAAGAHTTTNLIANASWLLLERGSLAGLRNDGAATSSAVEEVLRLESPIQAVFRTATRPTVLGGVRIDDNDRVCIVLAAANRDPEKFTQAHRFVADRTPNAHLSFAHGAHHCLGAALARLEARLALQRLAQHAPALRRTTAGPPARDALRLFRGPTALPVAA